MCRMGKVSAPNNFSSVQSWEELRRFASAFAADVFNQINGQLTFKDNLQGIDIDGSFPDANVSVGLKHGLGYIPNGFIVVANDSAAVIYNGIEKSTVDFIFLRSSVANVNAKVRVF
jgi:hypothetical protein